MPQIFFTILVHQLIFQGMFVYKNLMLGRKLGIAIRGKNPEANWSIVFFALFIACSLALSLFVNPFGSLQLVSLSSAMWISFLVLGLNVLISIGALISLKDSWRVGVIETDQTDLVTDGIYRFSRNPYFVSYFLMFLGYVVILQNVLLLVMAAVGFFFVHKMVLKEEAYLFALHQSSYDEYRRKVPRYLLF